MRYRSLAAAALSLAGVTAAHAADIYVAPGVASGAAEFAPGAPHSVYVAPGGTYIAGPVYVTPAPAYVPPPVPPRPAYTAPAAVYGAPPAYAAPARVYVEREPAYVVRERTIVAPPVYAREIAPRPPAAVPYHRPERCVVDLGYGRWDYCD
jgi:hypothetical protein